MVDFGVAPFKIGFSYTSKHTKCDVCASKDAERNEKSLEFGMDRTRKRERERNGSRKIFQTTERRRVKLKRIRNKHTMNKKHTHTLAQITREEKRNSWLVKTCTKFRPLNFLCTRFVIVMRMFIGSFFSSIFFFLSLNSSVLASNRRRSWMQEN